MGADLSPREQDPPSPRGADALRDDRPGRRRGRRRRLRRQRAHREDRGARGAPARDQRRLRAADHAVAVHRRAVRARLPLRGLRAELRRPAGARGGAGGARQEQGALHGQERRAAHGGRGGGRPRGRGAARAQCPSCRTSGRRSGSDEQAGGQVPASEPDPDEGLSRLRDRHDRELAPAGDRRDGAEAGGRDLRHRHRLRGAPDLRDVGRRQLRRHPRPRAGRGHRPEAGPAAQEIPDRRRRRRRRLHRHLAPDPRRPPQPGRDGHLRGQHGLRVDRRPVLADHAGRLRDQLQPVRHGGARLRSVRRRQGRRRDVRGGDDGDPVAPDGEDRQEGAGQRRLLVRARALPLQRELRRLRARHARHAQEPRVDLRAHAGAQGRRQRDRLHLGDRASSTTRPTAGRSSRACCGP